MDFDQLFKKYQSKGAEYLDVRFLKSTNEKIVLENKNPSISLSNSDIYGVRVFYKGAWGFSSGVNLQNISSSFEKAFNHAVKISKLIKDKFKLQKFSNYQANLKAPCKRLTSSVDLKDKIKDAYYLDSLLKDNPQINNRIIMFRFNDLVKNFLNSEGANITEEFSFSKIITQVFQNVNGSPIMGFSNHGGSYGYDIFNEDNLIKFSKEALEDLNHQIKAEMAPAGNMPILMDKSLTGVFFHEAVGHACEADHILQNISVLKDKLNQPIAPSFINLKDSPKIPNENGFYRYDDEGMPANETSLIKEGVLIGFMHSMETASKFNLNPTGNGRAMDPFSQPIPRMSNTILEKGDISVDEAISNIKKGIYAQGSAGGVVTPNDGSFLFNAQRAFLIENGKRTKLLKGVSFGGDILKTLKNITAVCNDAAPVRVGGSCGKNGQLVPVGEYAPSLLVSEVTVGGS